MSRLHRMALQVYTLGVIVAAMALDNEWLVLLAGALVLPLIAEVPRWREAAPPLARLDDWTMAEEVVLRAREDWALLLRRAFWAAWMIGWIAADRISAFVPAEHAVMARSLSITAAMLLLLAVAFLTRRQVSAMVVRRAEAAVKAEGTYASPG